MRKMTRRFLGLMLAMVMVMSQFANAGVVLADEQSTEGTWNATQYFTNGDFETGDDTGWSFNMASWDNWSSCWPKVVGDATNNVTNILNVYNGAEDGNTVTISQTISSVPAGTYRVSFEQDGMAATVSGFSVSVVDVTKALPATQGWDVWETITTDAFTLAEASDVTVTISGDLPAGYWCDFDNFVLEQYVASEVEDEPTDEQPEELELNVSDGTFEGDLWNDKVWTVTPEAWENTSFEYYTYSANEWIEPGENQGTTSFKFWSAAAQNVTLTQTVDIPAGTYKVTSDFMGEKGSIQVVFGGQQGTAVALNGFNAWVETSDIFTVAEDIKGATIGFNLSLEAAGYGYLDSISVTEVEPTDDKEDEDVKDEEIKDEEVAYAIEVTADQTAVKTGDTVVLTARVTKNGEEVTDLAAEGLYVWFWTDIWSAGTTDGKNDESFVKDENGLSFTAEATLPSVGTYYIVANIEDANKATIAKDTVVITVSDANSFTASDDNYTVVITVDNLAPEAGDTVEMTAKVTNAAGEEVTDLSTAGVSLWWWTDKWMSGHESGLMDAIYSTDANKTGLDLVSEVTLPSVGTYYIVGQLEYKGTKLAVVIPMTTTEAKVDTAISGEITVEKIDNLPEDFIMGMDISSVMSLFESGVTYKDFDGNTIDNITDFCKFLAKNGITHIRVRVWNDPFDVEGNGYGGGNCDVANAAKIAEGCRAAGIKMLIDFHCSDLWADPGKQQAPKAWANYSVSEKAVAVETFIGSALEAIDPECQTVDMVQVGNETTGGFVGVYNAADMCTLFSAGAKAVHEYNEDVKVVIHVTNPEKGNVTKWAANLNTYEVDYDVLATSYYPYWHGTLTNLKSQLKNVKDTYGKDVMVAETSYAYTLADSDGHSNTVRVGNNDSSENALHPFSVQGQAAAVRDVMETVNNAGGLGVFYWESAWITVGDITGLTGEALDAQIEANKAIWEEHGSGWASSFAAEYDAKDAGAWYGGSAVDNEAMFYPDGTPTAALYVWNYAKTGAVSKYTSVEEIANPEEKIDSNGTYTLPETVTVTYNSGELKESVTWNEADVEKIDTAVPGTYTVNGIVAFTKEVNSGIYAGQTTATVVYTLIVKQPNLITDTASAGFENGADYTIGGKGISSIPASDDPYSGSGSMHWYWSTATTGTVTYNPVISLEAGKYYAEIKTQGNAGDIIKIQILNTSDEVLFEGEETVLADWANWKTASVTFELDKTTDVKIRIVVAMQDGGWGTADELYLCQMAETVEDEKNPDEGKPSDGSGNSGSSLSNTNNNESTTGNMVTIPTATVSPETIVIEVVETTEAVQVAERVPAEEIVEEVVDEIVEENTIEESTVAEKEEVASESESTKVVILDEEVPLTANNGGSIPPWTVLVATLVFVGFSGLYVFAKQRKMIK